MLNFKPILPEDRQWLQPILNCTPGLCSDCSVSCMIMWGNAQIAVCDGFYIPKVTYDDQIYYLPPLGGSNYAPVLKKMEDDSRDRNIPFQIAGVTQTVREYWEQTQNYIYKPQYDNFDYIYSVDSLANLSGRKLQAKRNHIKHFELEYPNWSCEPISNVNLAECEQMTASWFNEHDSNLIGIKNEKRALTIAFENYESFGFEGVALRVNGQIAAYAMGVPLDKTTFDINFEKAIGSVPGAYAMINREFSRMLQRKYPEVQFLNREDDMGLPGLRKAKLSYHPVTILEKYTAVLPDGDI